MYPLIEIKTVPVEIRIKSQQASLEYQRGTAEMELSRNDNGELAIKSGQIKLQGKDSYEPQNSFMPYRPSTVTNVSNGDNAASAGFEVTNTNVSGGQLTMDARVLDQIMAARQTLPQINRNSQADRNININPNTGVNVDWKDGEFQIRYDIEKFNIDWNIEQGKFEFTPGDLEITAEGGEMLIKYLGGPIYVPASADPNYVDVKA